MHQGNTLTEMEDQRLEELRQRVREAQPHQPKPGDDDYLSPEQVAWIKAGEQE